MAQEEAPTFIVRSTWIPSGPVDEVSRRMAQIARRSAFGLGVAADLVRATIRPGVEGVMVPCTVYGGYCYRIIAVGGEGVSDLDLFLYDALSRQVDADRAFGNWPVIGLQRPLCIPSGVRPQSAQLRIRSFTGTGAVGVQMFAPPFYGEVTR